MKNTNSDIKKEWNNNHADNWNKFLNLNDLGLSLFQNNLLIDLKQILKNNTIRFDSKIKEHKEIDDNNLMVKLITVSIDENCKFWIYYDMAELDLKGKHQIYEKWNYLKPQDLIAEYLKSTKEILKLG